MVRAPYIDKNGLKKGAWSKEEDDKLKAYIQRYGHWNWRQLPKFAGLQRCGKSCRIRWLNYLRPDIKRGGYSKAEDDLIVELHEKLGSKWAKIAEQLPGRTDNEIKNHWHAHLKKCEKQNHGTPNQDLEEKAIESSQFGVDIPNVIEGEAEKTTTLVNPSQPVILESSPFSPTTSTESSSDSTHVNVLFDGDELDQKSSLWSEEEDDKLRACIQRYGLSSGRTEWDEPPCEISQSITEASDSIEQPTTEFPNLLTVSTTPADPMLDGFPLTPETTSSSTEFSFFSSDLNMAEDTMTQMEWFVEESSNPFGTFESDFWTEPYVLDTAGTKSCSYPSCLVDWQWSYE